MKVLWRRLVIFFRYGPEIALALSQEDADGLTCWEVLVRKCRRLQREHEALCVVIEQVSERAAKKGREGRT